MILELAGIESLPASTGVRLLAEQPAEAYRRSPPEMMNSEIVDAADLLHFQRVFQDAKPTVPGMRLYEIPDAVTLRLGEIVVGGRWLVTESVLHSRPPGPGSDRVLATALAAACDSVSAGRAQSVRDGLLMNQWSYRNYGHFLVELLPKLAFASRHADLGSAALLVNRGVTGGIADVYRDAVVRLGWARPLIPVLARAEVGRLLFVTTAGTHGINKHPDAVRELRRLFLRRTPAPGGRRLWVLRRNTYKRRLTNQDALIAVAHRFGFEVVEPEAMPVAEQAVLFNAADACIGPIGAGFTNIAFCRPGAQVVTLSPHVGRETFFYDLACIAGLTYAYLFGPAAEPEMRFNSDFSIDPARLDAALRRLAPPRAPALG